MMKPKTPFSVAASREAPKLRRNDAITRRSSSTCRKSCQPMLAVFITSAVNGIKTSAHRKNVEKPNVSPKPGRIEGCRKVDAIRIRLRWHNEGRYGLTDRRHPSGTRQQQW